MPPRLLLSLLAALVVVLAVAAPASASSVAYIDGHNLWYSSPDGARKVQVTSGGSEDASWQVPSQGRDGKTVVVHRDTFEGGSKRPVLYLYGADGKLVTANVMPVYSGAIGGAVYPIGLDMDWNSNAVAYGYQYCGFACQSLYRGYWLTFSDNQGAYPSNPQGASDAFNPTFYKTRVVSSDSGGNIFVQPDVPEAPFTSSYQGWLTHGEGYYLSRAEVSPANNQVAIEWLQDGGAEGITVAQHSGTVPSDLVAACDIQVAAHSGNLTFSPDGSQMAWKDDEGIKVAGVPNMAAGTDTCTLTAPPRVISASGSQPSFGGADVAAVGGVGGGQPSGGARGRRQAGRRLGGGTQAAQGPVPAQAHARRVRQGPHAQGRGAEGRPDRRVRLDPGQGRPQGRSARQGRRVGRPDREQGLRRRVDDGRRPRQHEGQAGRHGEDPAQADQGRQARRQADAQGRAHDQGQPGRRRRHGQDQASLAASGVLAASSLASTPRSAATSSSESTPPKRSSKAAANTAPMCANAAAPSRVSSARTTRRSWGAVRRLHPPALLQAVDQARHPAAAHEQRVGELVHRQPPPGSDHEPVDRLVLEQRRLRVLLEPPAQLRSAAACRRDAGPPTPRGARDPAGWAAAPPR